jgi:FMN-dependent NADH-azoreductase
MDHVAQEVQMKPLQIDSSARAGSVTRRLTAKFAEQWRANQPAGEVIERDVSTTILPLVTDDWSATQIEPSKRSSAQRNYLSASHRLIEELQVADTIVIGAPMYNFAIPPLLKAWIDQIVRVGKTFAYGPTDRQGLLGNERVFVIAARGGAYEKGTPSEKLDFQEPYLRHIFGFIGVTDVTFIHAENQLREGAGSSLAAALEQIGHVVAEQRYQLSN